MESFAEILPDAIGLSGVAIVLAAYFLLQTDRLKHTDLSYSLMNAIGSYFLPISLIFNFNLASMVIDVAWLMISLFGVWKFYRARQL